MVVQDAERSIFRDLSPNTLFRELVTRDTNLTLQQTCHLSSRERWWMAKANVMTKCCAPMNEFENTLFIEIRFVLCLIHVPVTTPILASFPSQTMHGCWACSFPLFSASSNSLISSAGIHLPCTKSIYLSWLRIRGGGWEFWHCRKTQRQNTLWWVWCFRLVITSVSDRPTSI